MGDITVREAGSKGGTTTTTRYSREELLERQKKGGNTTKERYGIEHYQELGRKSLEAKRAKKQVLDK